MPSSAFRNDFLPKSKHPLKNKEERKLFFCHFKIKVKGNKIFLLHLESHRPNQGYGKKFMDYLCKKADKHKMDIYLSAIPQVSQFAGEPLPNDILNKFYEDFGFKKYKKVKIYQNYCCWNMRRICSKSSL